MDSNRPKDIIEGFDVDFAHIVGDFSSAYPDLRLKDFFKYWTDKHLDCLFANRFDPRELLESILEINKLLVRTITDFPDQDRDVGLVALYFMLCLFAKQPPRLRRKVRFSCDDVIFIEKMISQPDCHPDARFVWRKLKTMQAIDFVEERTIYGPSMLINRGAKRGPDVEPTVSDVNRDQKDTKQFLENKIEPVLLAIEGICTGYEQIKNSLRLGDFKDSTVEIEPSGSVQEYIDRAKGLLIEFKSGLPDA